MAMSKAHGETVFARLAQYSQVVAPSYGRRVPPGTYVYKLILDVEDEQNKMNFFSVVY